MCYGINQIKNFINVIWICFVYPQQGGLHEKEARQNSIFVAYFLFQYLMNSIYLFKTRTSICVLKFYIAREVSLIFPLKTLIWNNMLLPASNSLNVLEPVRNELQKTFLRKYLAILFFTISIYRGLK